MPKKDDFRTADQRPPDAASSEPRTEDAWAGDAPSEPRVNAMPPPSDVVPPGEAKAEEPPQVVASRTPTLPTYIVKHTNVGGQYAQGEVIPHGVYSEEQLARLVELGAVEVMQPANVPEDAVVAMAESARTFKAEEVRRAVLAAGGTEEFADQVVAAESKLDQENV